MALKFYELKDHSTNDAHKKTHTKKPDNDTDVASKSNICSDSLAAVMMPKPNQTNKQQQKQKNADTKVREKAKRLHGQDHQ